MSDRDRCNKAGSFGYLLVKRFDVDLDVFFSPRMDSRFILPKKKGCFEWENGMDLEVTNFQRYSFSAHGSAIPILHSICS